MLLAHPFASPCSSFLYGSPVQGMHPSGVQRRRTIREPTMERIWKTIRGCNCGTLN
jgi:hypothetical protein